MDASAFASILEDLVPRIPGAYAAALVDAQGETVDYAGTVNPFDVKVAAAHWRIVLDDIARSFLGEARSLVARAARASYIAHTLPDGYAIIVLLGRRAGFASTSRALSSCVRALHAEANWPSPGQRGAWYALDVSCDRRGRPVTVRATVTVTTSAANGEARAQPVDVLGAIMGLARGERGYRVRLESGVEVTLVREPRGFWYSDEPLDQAARAKRDVRSPFRD
jgi:hypothetical protein